MTFEAVIERDVSVAPAELGVRRARFWTLRRIATPIVILLVLLALFVWIQTLEIDSIMARTLNVDYILLRTREHLELTFIASALVAVLAIPAGIVASRTRSRILRGTILTIANIGQATPAIGFIILLAIIWQIGFQTALIALVAYSFLPVLRNTMVGLSQIDASVTESARGMGMTPGQVLMRIELPLAVPVILAGLRTSLVFCVGVATVATFIDAGGLGDMIVNGLKLQRFPVLITGAVLVSCIALLIDWLASIAEDLLRPKGV
ncbi:ABC transporter permease [Subtercola boreus]|uniref:ABC transporter permease n=1 Tax=Subtercola boreus TaxID=120213 RepID=A0A3E0VN44_9MICO|nr:ABC transporter permease [Subtercola boreus]RFA10317.1 ABC transporter permease [Subtercola boreus]TQL56177.1 osmoprotectant transport system permease protein [Subtercola boreus]